MTFIQPRARPSAGYLQSSTTSIMSAATAARTGPIFSTRRPSKLHLSSSVTACWRSRFTSFCSARSARHIPLALRLVGVVPRHLRMMFFRNCTATTPISSSIDDLVTSLPALFVPFTRPDRRVYRRPVPLHPGATPATQLATSVNLSTEFPTATLALCRGNTFIPTWHGQSRLSWRPPLCTHGG